MQTTSPQYIPATDGQNGVLYAPFVYRSIYCLNLSDKWVYIVPGATGSTSVTPQLYTHVIPPFSQGILPGVGQYLSYLVSTESAFTITATVGQNVGNARVTFIMYDVPMQMPIVALPGTTIAAELVSGDLTVDRLHALIAASIGAGAVDDTTKLLITPNDASDAGIRIQGVASQSGKYLEILDNTTAVVFDVEAGGNVHIGSLPSGRVLLSGTSGLINTDADITFSGSRLTITDLTVANSPIVSALTAGRVAIVGASKEITDDAGLTYDAANNNLTVSNNLIVNNVVFSLQLRSSILTPGRVVYVGASDNLTDEAGFEYDAALNTLTVTAMRSPSASGGIGFSTGAGGTVTQTGSKTTAVTLNTMCGVITMDNANLNAGATAQFQLNNSNIASGDILILQHVSNTFLQKYRFESRSGTGEAQIAVTNITAGNLSEAVQIKFVIIKAVTT